MLKPIAVSFLAAFIASVLVMSRSHVSVLDVLPVHQHVVPTQRPHLALTRHHVALKRATTVSVHLWNRNRVDAVGWEA